MSLIASSDRFVESVRMYVMRPSSYSFWAIRIVVFTENPSLFPASCCRVEVVNGGAGARFTGFTLKSATEKEADAQCSRKNTCLIFGCHTTLQLRLERFHPSFLKTGR